MLGYFAKQTTRRKILRLYRLRAATFCVSTLHFVWQTVALADFTQLCRNFCFGTALVFIDNTQVFR